METIEMKKEKMYKVKNDILIYLSEDVQIKFNKVFEWPDSCGARIAHLNIWETNAPFYILYNKSIQSKLSIKGYKNCLFIPNSFYMGFDRNKKMYLRATIIGANCMLKYYPITSVKDIRELVKLRQSGKMIFAGFPNNHNGISSFGEAFEIVKIY